MTGGEITAAGRFSPSEEFSDHPGKDAKIEPPVLRSNPLHLDGGPKGSTDRISKRPIPIGSGSG